MRNVRNPRPQNTNAADPANCTVDAFGMNRTIATKMTTRSKEFSTLATKVGATFSEIMSRSEIPARPQVMAEALGDSHWSRARIQCTGHDAIRGRTTRQEV